ncbi:ABC transporter ATP-binding protein [Diplocloster agilis]|nr:ABC transporter ATP-binding protein [Suonthocola fibrivorans]MCU6733319.1 ABC transporter ATP-binding protein/permease [Suonthocola fibrivorans]SCI87025.1 Lipid A export ATP-binding/permease protein MsbA [uncultured Clostridium sp.]
MKNIFGYLRSYLGLAILSPILMIGEVLADLTLPYLMSFIVNYGIIGMQIDGPDQGSRFAAGVMTLLHKTGYGRMDIIVTFGFLMLAVTLLGGCFGVSTAYTSARAAQGLGNDLRLDTFGRIMNLSVQQTDHFTTGSLINRITNDIAMVIEFVEQMLRGFVRPPMFIIGGAVMLFLLDVKFGLILLSTIPVLAVIIFLVLRRAIPHYSMVQQRLDKVNSIVQENLNGARVVKAYVREEYECGRFEEANSKLKQENYRVLKLMAVISPVLSILLNIAVILVIYVGGLQIRIEQAGMTTGALMAAITYMTQSLNSVMMAANLFQSISRADASAARISEVLKTEPVIKGGSRKPEDNSSGGRENCVKTAILFNNVSFRYPGTKGRPVLHNINLELRKGEMLAVIGATGSGKSSLAALIPRFYDADEGEVLIDGVPVKDYPLEELRGKIGYVMQKAELFSDTIEENIRWGKKDADTKQIRHAARIAQADFILDFQNQYDTYIAEKGASLSGGQKQRISIARALVRTPQILILDDATSALDLVTENAFRSALKASLSDTTVLLIAQRIASIMDADRIVVLENDGTIRYCGKHQELLKVSETYRNIYDSQMRAGVMTGKEGR